jgi:hypothetical protein
LRYNAVVLPVVATIAIVLSKQASWRKLVSVATTYLCILTCIIITKNITKSYLSSGTFSAFSGWQMANNALHVLRFKDVDTTGIKDKEVKQVIGHTKLFLDTTKEYIPPGASAWYMWHPNSPLKQYMRQDNIKRSTYFRTWYALGPIYNRLGTTIILKNPGSYIKHFVIPNTKEYFYPRLEIFENYYEEVDTLASIATSFYSYKTNKITTIHPTLHRILYAPWPLLFLLINLLLIVLIAMYVKRKKIKEQPSLFNYILLCFVALYLINFFFVTLLAPTVLRYHIFILTLSYPLILYLIQLLRPRTGTNIYGALKTQ